MPDPFRRRLPRLKTTAIGPDATFLADESTLPDVGGRGVAREHPLLRSAAIIDAFINALNRGLAGAGRAALNSLSRAEPAQERAQSISERSRPLPTSAAEEDNTRVSCLRLAIFRVLVGAARRQYRKSPCVLGRLGLIQHSTELYSVRDCLTKSPNSRNGTIGPFANRSI
jgi:hypothetical protein